MEAPGAPLDKNPIKQFPRLTNGRVRIRNSKKRKDLPGALPYEVGEAKAKILEWWLDRLKEGLPHCYEHAQQTSRQLGVVAIKETPDD
jgi:hypothetical protein